MATTFSTISDAKIVALGNYLYAAPEQYETPDAEISRKPTTDIYGFGQLSYFAILGQDPPRERDGAIAALRDRLGRWGSAQAAKMYLSMYKKCIQRKPSERFNTMNEVSSILIDIRNALLDPDRTQSIDADKFLSELVFSLYGLEIQPTKSFLSRSGQVQIDIQGITSHAIEAKFDVIHGFVGQTGSYAQQRDNINRRVDDAILDLKKIHHKNIIRHSEKHSDMYGTRIELRGSNLNLDGVAICRQVILSVIKCIES